MPVHRVKGYEHKMIQTIVSERFHSKAVVYKVACSTMVLNFGVHQIQLRCLFQNANSQAPPLEIQILYI